MEPSELCSLECENGSSSESELNIYNGRMAYVTRYYKARTTINKELNVVRFLAPRPGLLLLYYLVYIIRLSKMLLGESGIASREELNTSLLFHSDKTPGTPWKASRLSSVLRRMSKGDLAKPVGIRLYRQLSIGITEKHVKEAFQPFERHNDRSLEADLMYLLPGRVNIVHY